jgi:hypothetical protein
MCIRDRMHTRANAQGAARTQFGSQGFALYLEQVAAIAVRKKQYPDQASIEKVSRMCLGMPELENVKFFKSSIVRKRTPSPMVPVRGFPGRMTGLTGGPVGWLAQTA